MTDFWKAALEDRLLDLLTSVKTGSVSPTEAMFAIRGEVISNFYRGLKAQRKTPRRKRDVPRRRQSLPRR